LEKRNRSDGFFNVSVYFKSIVFNPDKYFRNSQEELK